jgi:hypothetical protein
MRKVFFTLFFVLLATTVFSQDYINTSEGTYAARIDYSGKNIGQKHARLLNKSGGYIANVKLTNGQWQVVETMLRRYKLERGDTFRIIMILGMYNVIVIYEVGGIFKQSTYWAFTER